MEKREERERTLISRTGISSRGFTLLEIIVVLFIISITLGIVIPSINIERSLGSEVKRFASVLRYLLDEAATKKETLYLTIKIPEKRIIYEVSEGKKEGSLPHLVEISSSSRGSLKDSSLTIFFYPSGVREGFVFIFQDKKERYEVKINPVSNRVKIERV
ncbi:MAG: Tfp pilus assembly protein FimT/FimU [Thermodesulfovibrionales bacterium]